MATVDFGKEVLFGELVVVGAGLGDGEVEVVVGTGDVADEVLEVVSLGAGVVVVVSVVAVSVVAAPVVVAGSVVDVVPLVVSAVVGSVAEARPRPVSNRAHTTAGTVASLAQRPALPPSDNVPSFRQQRAALAVAPPGRAPGAP